jgi:hypothetical protein
MIEYGRHEYKDHITKCLLDDGSLLFYDEAMNLEFSKEHPDMLEDLMNNPKRKYLGTGTIFSVDGVEQKNVSVFGKCYFFQYLQ